MMIGEICQKMRQRFQYQRENHIQKVFYKFVIYLLKVCYYYYVFHERKNTFKCESCGYSCFQNGTLNENIISIHERNNESKFHFNS